VSSLTGRDALGKPMVKLGLDLKQAGNLHGRPKKTASILFSGVLRKLPSLGRALTKSEKRTVVGDKHRTGPCRSTLAIFFFFFELFLRNRFS